MAITIAEGIILAVIGLLLLAAGIFVAVRMFAAMAEAFQAFEKSLGDRVVFRVTRQSRLHQMPFTKGVLLLWILVALCMLLAVVSIVLLS